ncbi:hypothetical protein A3770_01p01750 [Chloropicon primus]|uniref:Uncharacterized protein n=1 Tax=Chloropicon primus TaxID=1764295 RepID=A0A5B8MBB2_9CHLO|nr:hypothetical protein A3770_01p01750 [Chloropicon primus]|eukprot:QDZ17657.1 hypothetical protein A3770_01p01750 [Chloropicon primus]
MTTGGGGFPLLFVRGTCSDLERPFLVSSAEACREAQVSRFFTGPSEVVVEGRRGERRSLEESRGVYQKYDQHAPHEHMQKMRACCVYKRCVQKMKKRREREKSG